MEDASAATVKIPTCRSMPRGRWRAISCAAMSKKGIGRLIWVQRLRRLPKDGLSMRFPWPRWKRRSATAVCRLPNITLCTGVHRLPMRKRPSCCSGFMTIALPITAIRPPLRVLQVNPCNHCPIRCRPTHARRRSARCFTTIRACRPTIRFPALRATACIRAVSITGVIPKA